VALAVAGCGGRVADGPGSGVGPDSSTAVALVDGAAGSADAPSDGGVLDAAEGSIADGALADATLGTVADADAPLDATLDADGDSPWADAAPPHVLSIKAGDDYACALLEGGTVACWGANSGAQLGNGTDASSSTPTPVANLDGGAIAIATGYEHACALLSTGGAVCWGDNGYGQVAGDASTASTNIAVAVANLWNGTAIAAGYRDTCAILADATLGCWGSDEEQFLGVPVTGPDAPIGPLTVLGFRGVTDVALGYGFGCVVLSEGGTVECWGSEALGQLGGGPIGEATTLSPLSGSTAVAAGGPSYACALLDGGTVACWGNNGSDILATGPLTQPYGPVAIAGLSDARALATGGDHVCALGADGTVACWGQGAYQDVGDGAAFSPLTPTVVPGLAGVTAIAAGTSFTCTLLADATVQCWGQDPPGTTTSVCGVRRCTPQPQALVW
jgi:alpha-tubulin suppressor-like RCC1 family protein